MKNIIKINNIEFSTLVAISEEDHEYGLMYYKSPAPVMTFPYKKAMIRKFWMYNTIIPLDIIFCMAGNVIDVCYGEPLSKRYVGPNVACDLVIELPYGSAKNYNITVGSSAKLFLDRKTYLQKLSYELGIAK